MTTKLIVWNQALVHLGSAPIADTTNTSVMAVNVFNNAWPGVVEEAFNEGDWNFAKKTVPLLESLSGVASSGYSYAYEYPSDYFRTVAVSPNPNFMAPFDSYLDEGLLLHSSVTDLYIRYISNAYLDDLTVWPTMFWRYAAAKLAYETCERITQGSTREDKLEKVASKALSKAKSVDARNQQGGKIVRGSWLKGMKTDGAGGGAMVVTGSGEIVLREGDV